MEDSKYRRCGKKIRPNIPKLLEALDLADVDLDIEESGFIVTLVMGKLAAKKPKPRLAGWTEAGLAALLAACLLEIVMLLANWSSPLASWGLPN